MADIGKIKIAKLTNDNYFTWKYKMQLFLLREKSWNVVNEDKPVLPEDPSAQQRRDIKEWVKKMIRHARQ